MEPSLSLLPPRPPCRRCGVGKRKPFRDTCQACLDEVIQSQGEALTRQYHEDSLADEARWALERPPPPPVPLPASPCAGCGSERWQAREPGGFACAACGDCA